MSGISQQEEAEQWLAVGLYMDELSAAIANIGDAEARAVALMRVIPEDLSGNTSREAITAFRSLRPLLDTVPTAPPIAERVYARTIRYLTSLIETWEAVVAALVVDDAAALAHALRRQENELPPLRRAYEHAGSELTARAERAIRRGSGPPPPERRAKRRKR